MPRFAGRLGLIVSTLVSLSYCGGDDGGESDDEADGPTIELGAVPCGQKGCKLSADVAGGGLRACCADAFAGVCGVTTRKRDDCRELPNIEPRCPVPADLTLDTWFGDGTGTGKTFGCCSIDNQCGFDVIGDYDVSPVLIAPPGFGLEQEGPNPRCIPRLGILCDLASSQLISKDQIDPRTCDGEPLPLPERCGDPWSFPPFPVP
jgi:hypothetical protein